MTDLMTPEQRHRCMAAIKGRDTRPEITVRRFLFAKGLRFRVNYTRLPGKPDIVLPKYRTAIFVNGCFWHGHENCELAHLPASNTEFWRKKIELNKARDRRVAVELRLKGWRVIRLWECALKVAATRAQALEALYDTITAPSAPVTANPQPYAAVTPGYQTAAESPATYRPNKPKH